MASKSLPKIIYRTTSTWKEMVKKLTVGAVSQGLTAIDTANQPNNRTRELFVGNGLKKLYEKHDKKREDLWLQTKFIPIGDKGYKDGYYYPYDHKAPVSSQIRESLQTSLGNLHTSYLDSYILHDPLHMVEPSTPSANPKSLWDDVAVRENIYTAWKELCALRDEGVVRAIGVSNCYDVDVLKALMAERKVEIVQNRWSEQSQSGLDKKMIVYCRENGIMFQAFWPPRNLAVKVFQYAHIMAKSLQCTPAQIILRIAQINGITALMGGRMSTAMHDAVVTEHLNLDNYTTGSDKRFEALQESIIG